MPLRLRAYPAQPSRGGIRVLLGVTRPIQPRRQILPVARRVDALHRDLCSHDWLAFEANYPSANGNRVGRGNDLLIREAFGVEIGAPAQAISVGRHNGDAIL